MHSSRHAEGREWSGGDGSGVEGRGGKGRAGQGRVPDCLGGLSRVGISSRSTRPWNGQPPSLILKAWEKWSKQNLGLNQYRLGQESNTIPTELACPNPTKRNDSDKSGEIRIYTHCIWEMKDRYRCRQQDG